MFAVRQDAGWRPTGSPPPWRAPRNPRLRLPTSGPATGIELGYITLAATLLAILGVAVASFTTTPNATPASTGAGPEISTINTAPPGTSRAIARDRMSLTLIHNLGARSAINSAMGRF